MKILQDNSHDASYIGDVQKNRVGIDRNNIDFITTLLTSNLYSKPLESFLRETIANAYDSHVEAGTDEYILLVITRTGYSQFNVLVRDYGVGVSPERFNEIYRNIGSSTKRDSNDYIGAFGIGRFAGLSCADVVNINSYYKGTKYSYLMYKNGSGINIDKLSETHNDNFKNGLEVSVTVENRENEFVSAIKKLILFDKLHIEYINQYQGYSYNYSGDLKSHVQDFNDRKIVKCKTFCLPNSSFSGFGRYLKVGNIIYSNNYWDNFDTYSNIIIDIPMGEVDITPNREELQFTERTKKTIAKCIENVKIELQEFADKIFAKDLTINQYYKLITNNVINYPIGECSLSISKKDILLTKLYDCTINGEKVPQNFNTFIKLAGNKLIPKEDIYKIFNTGVLHNHYRITRTSANFDCILAGSTLFGYKKDTTTKSVTTEWFSDSIGDKCTIVVKDFDIIKKSLEDYCKSNSISNNDEYDECVKFLFRNLDVQVLANDLVPQSFIDSYREDKKAKKNHTLVPNEEIEKMTIRRYVNSDDRYYFIDTFDSLPNKGLVIYTSHTKEDKQILALSSLLRSINSVTIITVKKEYFPVLEGDKRFIFMEDFLQFPNKILKKIATAKVIQDAFMKSAVNLKMDFSDLTCRIPIVREFKTKYYEYLKTLTSSAYYKSDFIRDLIDSYIQKGYYNKADINYFKMDSSDEEAISTLYSMEAHKSDIIRCMAFFMFGKKDKIGLKSPNINICKYLKKFKYECI